MGNRSPGTRRNRLTSGSQSSSDGHVGGNDCDKPDENNREVSVTGTKDSEQTRNEEHLDNCHPAANSPLMAGAHNHFVKNDKESLVDSDHMEEGKKTTKVQTPVDNNDRPISIYSLREASVDGSHEACEPTKPMDFMVVLECIPESSQKVVSLNFVNKYPRTVLDLKQGIEDKFGIPTSCQNIFVEDIQLCDMYSLKFYRVRVGDTLHVRYSSEADVGTILDIIASLRSMITYIEGIQLILSHGKPSEYLRRSIPENIFADKVESLAFEYFYPCSSERANANRLLFVQHGGLDLMHRVHKLLLLQPWQNIPIEMQYLEHAILRVLWNITASFTIRRLVLQRPTLKAIIKSFLRVQIPKEGTVSAPANCFSHPPIMELNRITSEVVYKATGSLCNLAELPECRMEIASNKQVLEQLIAVITTRTYKYIASLVSVAGMLCLAYSPETHPYLSEESIIGGIHYACHFDRPYIMSAAERRLDKLLLMYFSCVFYSQLLTLSPYLFTLNQKITIAKFISGFLNEATPNEIRNHEVKNGYKWSTVIPLVKVAYYPRHSRKFSMEVHRDTDPDACDSMRDPDTIDTHDKDSAAALNMLAVHCIETGVFSMQNVLHDEEIRDVLVHEGLVDFITCMPWNVPQESRVQQRARELVTFLSQHMQLQPPSLVNMTKARLASLNFGLDKVLNTHSVHELLTGN